MSKDKTSKESVNSALRNTNVSGSVVLLEWVNLEGHFGQGWISIIEGWSTNYAIWIDRNTGKTKVSGLDRKHSEHNSVDDAKRWCQHDFNNKVKSLVTDR